MLFVYLIKQTDNSLYKIGVSKNPKRRLKSLQTANGVQLELVDIFKSELGYKIEKYLHRFFKEKKTIGEWFSLETHEVYSFGALCYTKEKSFNYLFENNSYLASL